MIKIFLTEYKFILIEKKKNFDIMRIFIIATIQQSYTHPPHPPLPTYPTNLASFSHYDTH